MTSLRLLWDQSHTSFHQGEDILAVELDSTGSLQWKFVAGTTAGDIAHAVQLDASNNVILAGTTGRGPWTTWTTWTTWTNVWHS